MRVRPFFWALLALACAGVLIFATVVSIERALPMHAHIDQVSSVTSGSTLVRLHLTDAEGTPIDQASVIPQAFMPAMSMGPQRTSVQALGQGVYLARISFSMMGLWNIDIIAHADGFAPIHQSIRLTVL
jgi:nitrogen fixation protein FixH